MSGLIGNKEHVASEPKVFYTYICNEADGIGQIDYSGDIQKDIYPLPQRRAFGIPLYIDNATNSFEAIGVKIVTALPATTKKYAGVSEEAATLNMSINTRVAGDIFLPIGLTAVVDGDWVILEVDSTENGSLATAGDVIPIETASTAGYGAVADVTSIFGRLRAWVGIAMTGGAARVDANNVTYIRVRMRGF